MTRVLFLTKDDLVTAVHELVSYFCAVVAHHQQNSLRSFQECRSTHQLCRPHFLEYIFPDEKYIRENGVYITDVWNDILEMTSGYFAGDEPLRHKNKKRVHEQQSPNHLLLRIILSSSMPGDLIFDPFAGTGTTMIVARQLMRKSLGIEIDQDYFAHINQR